MIFPERVLGKSPMMKIFLGAANGPMTLRTWRTSSLIRADSLLGSYLNSLEIPISPASPLDGGKKKKNAHGLRVTNAKTA